MYAQCVCGEWLCRHNPTMIGEHGMDQESARVKAFVEDQTRKEKDRPIYAFADYVARLFKVKMATVRNKKH